MLSEYAACARLGVTVRALRRWAENDLLGTDWNGNYREQDVERLARDGGNRVLSTGQAAAIIGVTPDTIRNYRARGVLEPSFVTLGNRARYYRADVELLLSYPPAPGPR